jgi:hypothetical protein
VSDSPVFLYALKSSRRGRVPGIVCGLRDGRIFLFEPSPKGGSRGVRKGGRLPEERCVVPKRASR